MNTTTPTMPPRAGRHRSALGAFAALSVLVVALLTTAAPADATYRIPFKSSDAGTFTTTPLPSTLEDPLVLTEDVATGHATHLAAYEIRAHEVVNLRTLAVTQGGLTLIAANGDTLVGIYEGSAAPTSNQYVITYSVVGPVTGGTGRFAGATGSITWNGIADLGSGQLSDKASGWISSPGSLR